MINGGANKDFGKNKKKKGKGDGDGDDGTGKYNWPYKDTYAPTVPMDANDNRIVH